MTRYAVQIAPASYQLVDAPSPRAAALLACGSTHHVIVWYRTRRGWASWMDGRGRQIRYAGKVDERVAHLLADRPPTRS